ncbi:MAG: hypothetical protein ACRYGK_13755 [Janthinobacterium lividum]
MDEMKLLVRAGMIFSEALCQAYNPNKTFVTDYNQNVLSHVTCMKANLIESNYFEKNWEERTKYYDLKVDEIVGKLADEQANSSKSIEPESLMM